MSPIFDWLFGQYASYQPLFVSIEIVGVLFGFASVWLAKKNHVGVYPTGIISTALFVYLLWQWGLLGDMMINAYYFSMSIYGWYVWTQKPDGEHVTPISSMLKVEKKTSILIFMGALLSVFVVYESFDKWDNWTAYVDALTTAIFFVGMWLMARRKIENWIFWIVGDIISVPLYLYKGLSLTAIQYLIFTFVAFAGYQAWKKILDNKQPAA